jgi:hypothetical protein
VVSYARYLCRLKHDDGDRAMLDLAQAMGYPLSDLDRTFLERRPVYQIPPDEAYSGTLDERQRSEVILDRDEDDDGNARRRPRTCRWSTCSCASPRPWARPRPCSTPARPRPRPRHPDRMRGRAHGGVGPRLQATGKDPAQLTAQRFLLGRTAEMLRPENIVAAGLPHADFILLLGLQG